MKQINPLDPDRYVIMARSDIEEHMKSLTEAQQEVAEMGLRYEAEISRLMQIICDASPDDDYLLVRQEADAIWARIHKYNEGTKG